MFTKETYPKLIRQIHAEVETASDRLVSEAKEIIGRTGHINLDKISRLEKLGFNKTVEVVQSKDVLAEKKEKEELATMAQYYRMTYPNYRFIDMAGLDRITQKYGLVIGDVSMFTGFVPEEKLAIMEDFKLKDYDYIHHVTINKYDTGAGRLSSGINERIQAELRKINHRFILEDYAPSMESVRKEVVDYLIWAKRLIESMSESQLNDSQLESQIGILTTYRTTNVPHDQLPHISIEELQNNPEVDLTKNILIQMTQKHRETGIRSFITEFIKQIGHHVEIRESWVTVTRNDKLMIVAPKKDFDSKGTVVTKKGMSKFLSYLQPDAVAVDHDPIVGTMVRKGFLAACAWGDEQSDIDVVNHAMN